jgi:hypothetical protein
VVLVSVHVARSSKSIESKESASFLILKSGQFFVTLCLYCVSKSYCDDIASSVKYTVTAVDKKSADNPVHFLHYKYCEL